MFQFSQDACSIIFITTFLMVVSLFPANTVGLDAPITETDTVCKSSSDCQLETEAKCCRADGGGGALLLTGNEGNWGQLLVPDEREGRCSPRRPKKGEICEPGSCSCEAGSECYRPISGACCPPYLCYDAVWVQKQREYWKKCFSDPKCALPPVALPPSQGVPSK